MCHLQIALVQSGRVRRIARPCAKCLVPRHLCNVARGTWLYCLTRSWAMFPSWNICLALDFVRLPESDDVSTLPMATQPWRCQGRRCIVRFWYNSWKQFRCLVCNPSLGLTRCALTRGKFDVDASISTPHAPDLENENDQRVLSGMWIF